MKGLLEGEWIMFAGAGVEGVGKVHKVSGNVLVLEKAMRLFFDPLGKGARIGPMFPVAEIKNCVYLPIGSYVITTISDPNEVKKYEEHWNKIIASRVGIILATPSMISNN